MRICLILEGSYPYVHGGVSTWMHQYIQNMPQHEFVLWVIGAKSKSKGQFVYQLPDNVVEVHEVFLDDALHVAPSKRLFDYHFTASELNWRHLDKSWRQGGLIGRCFASSIRIRN